MPAPKPGGNKPGGSQFAQGGGGLGQNQKGQYQTGQDFWKFNPRDVAGINPLLVQAGRGAAGLTGVGAQDIGASRNLLTQAGGDSAYSTEAANRARSLADNPNAQFEQGMNALDAMRAVSQRKVTGAGLESDASFKAARQAYSNSIAKRTQNAAALAGLGRSTSLQAAQGAGEANYLMPTIENAFAREERGIGRELSTLGQQAQGYFGASGQRTADQRTGISALQQAGGAQTQRQLAAAGGLGNLAQADRATAQNAIQAQQALGTQGRDIKQEQLDAPHQEQQRLYKEALNTMYGPLGMIGSLIGADSSTSKK